MTASLNDHVIRRVTRSTTRQAEAGDRNSQVISETVTQITSRKSYTDSQLNERRQLIYKKTLSASRTPSIHAERFGLIQEKVAHNLYQLLVAATLWNRTKGSQARPIFFRLIQEYPSPGHLAKADEAILADFLRPLGLQNSRARRFLLFAQAWLENAPTRDRRYRKLNYPSPGSGKDIAPREVLDLDDPREGWEIAHLPGMGPYALDSFRIFHRDILRGLATDWLGTNAPLGFEPEWKRVVPLDKELKACLRWMWLKEGWIWNPVSGHKVKASTSRMKQEQERLRSLSPELI